MLSQPATNLTSEQTDQATKEIVKEREQFGHCLRLRSSPYRKAVQAIQKRDGLEPVCGHSTGGISIDHIRPVLIPCLLRPGIFHPDHSLENLRIICYRCNSSKGGSRKETNIDFVSVKEKTTVAVAPVEPEWSSKEGSKSERMRAKWNNWIKTKPFKSINLQALARMAPHQLGEGSSITYRRYAEEDVASGVLEGFTMEGKGMVRFTDKETRMLIEQKENEQGNLTL